MSDSLLLVAEVADQLRCSRKFVLDELHRGNLVGSRFGRTWRVAQSALDSYVEAHLNVRPIRRRRSA